MATSANIRQKKSMGQVFLTVDWPLERMLEKLRSWNINRVIEIGPGAGIFTKLLVKNGIHVTAIEKDDRFAELMKQWANDFNDEYEGSLDVINVDILKYDFSEWIERGNSAGHKSAIIGNIPYNISSPIVMKILPILPQITGSLMMTQLEFTKRLAANSGNKDYGSLSVFAQLRADVAMEFEVGRDCFKPIPRVDSAVVSLQERKSKFSEVLLKNTETITRSAFNQRRKKMRNSISQFIEDPEVEKACPIDLDRRADSVDPLEYIELAKFLF